MNGQQTRTCKTEAAFGGDNTACQKVNGQYPVRSTLATLAARFPALSRRILMAVCAQIETQACECCSNGGGPSAVGDSSESLQQQIAEMQRQIELLQGHNPAAPVASGTPAPAPSSSWFGWGSSIAEAPQQDSPWETAAIAAGGAIVVIVVIAVAVVRRARKHAYKQLNDAERAEQGSAHKDQESGTALRCSA